MPLTYYVNSSNNEFEKAMQKEYSDLEETEFSGSGQRFYRIDKTLVTITSWHSPKAGDNIPKGYICVEIDKDNKNIRREIEARTKHKLKKL